MKRFLLILALLNSAAMAMDRPYAMKYFEYQMAKSSKEELGKELNALLKDVVLQNRTNKNKFIGATNLAKINSLIEAGADLGQYIHNPTLSLAAETENIPLIKLLFAYGADANQKDATGNTPLYHYIATGNRNLEIIKLLIENRATLNIQNNSGDTPLMQAVRQNWLEGVKILIQSNIQIIGLLKDQMSYFKLLPADILPIIAKYQEEVRANLNMKDRQGNTALMYAKNMQIILKDERRGIERNRRLKENEEIIRILDLITEETQPQQSWWQRLRGR